MRVVSLFCSAFFFFVVLSILCWLVFFIWNIDVSNLFSSFLLFHSVSLSCQSSYATLPLNLLKCWSLLLFLWSDRLDLEIASRKKRNKKKINKQDRRGSEDCVACDEQDWEREGTLERIITVFCSPFRSRFFLFPRASVCVSFKAIKGIACLFERRFFFPNNWKGLCVMRIVRKHARRWRMRKKTNRFFFSDLDCCFWSCVASLSFFF